MREETKRRIAHGAVTIAGVGLTVGAVATAKLTDISISVEEANCLALARFFGGATFCVGLLVAAANDKRVPTM